MDVLSSMATICGYKAVVLAADTSPRIFPMLTTAAGTITPGRVIVIGAGVAGLQAIATRSEEHTSELQSRLHIVCRLLLEKKQTRATSSLITATSIRVSLVCTLRS